MNNTIKSMDSVPQRRTELRQAIRDLHDRGLFTAAKWAAEQLAGAIIHLPLPYHIAHRPTSWRVSAQKVGQLPLPRA